MKILTADQGNTLLKLTLFEDGREVAAETVGTSAPEECLPVIDGWQPDGGIFCSVGRFDIRFVETMRQLVSDRLLVLTPQTPLPITIDYDSPETLGVDRIASAVGASALYPDEGCVVADCGSAITIDLIDRTGIFRGGRISPGLEMRAKAMSSYTARLPFVSGDGDVPFVGRTTETSLRSGIVFGIAHELAGAVADYSEDRGVRRLVLTGGDSARLYPFVRKAISDLRERFDVNLVPNLLNKGLLHIYEYNLKHENI